MVDSSYRINVAASRGLFNKLCWSTMQDGHLTRVYSSSDRSDLQAISNEIYWIKSRIVPNSYSLTAIKNTRNEKLQVDFKWTSRANLIEFQPLPQA